MSAQFSSAQFSSVRRRRLTFHLTQQHEQLLHDLVEPGEHHTRVLSRHGGLVLLHSRVTEGAQKLARGRVKQLVRLWSAKGRVGSKSGQGRVRVRSGSGASWARSGESWVRVGQGRSGSGESWVRIGQSQVRIGSGSGESCVSVGAGLSRVRVGSGSYQDRVSAQLAAACVPRARSNHKRFHLKSIGFI